MNVVVLFVLLGCWAVIGQAAPTKQQLFDVEVEELETVEDAEQVDGYFEGDIELEDHRNAITRREKIWPEGVVPYVFASSITSSVKKMIEASMREIESDTKHGSTNCVSFRPKNSTEKDYIHIERGDGCHFITGKRFSGGVGNMSIGWGCDRKGIIMHELLHALGFYHEHTRYDRDDYVEIDLDNVPLKRRENFYKRNTLQITTFNVSYDYGSIMHYGPYTFASDPSKPSMTPKPGMARGATMGQRLQLSTKDVVKIQKLYNCTVDTSHIRTTAKRSYVVDCNFEEDLCNLVQDSKDDFEWTRHKGSTKSKKTGPYGDHTNGGGYYVYAEASDHIHKYARLRTETIPAGSYCVSFALFDYGENAGKFSVRIEGGEVLNRAVQTWKGSQRNQWVPKRLNLNSPKPFNLVFESYIGNGFHGDMALDDVQIYHGECL